MNPLRGSQKIRRVICMAYRPANNRLVQIRSGRDLGERHLISIGGDLGRYVEAADGVKIGQEVMLPGMDVLVQGLLLGHSLCCSLEVHSIHSVPME